jgi:hypothetical protein
MRRARIAVSPSIRCFASNRFHYYMKSRAHSQSKVIAAFPRIRWQEAGDYTPKNKRTVSFSHRI